jgi:nitrate/nitrite transporter NarK
MGMVGMIIVIIILVSSVAAWMNTKTIQEDLAKIKEALQIQDEKNDYLLDTSTSENQDQKE